MVKKILVMALAVGLLTITPVMTDTASLWGGEGIAVTVHALDENYTWDASTNTLTILSDDGWAEAEGQVSLSKVKKLVAGKNVTSCPDLGALYTSLESVNLSGSNIDYISSNTFNGCSHLKTVDLSGCLQLDSISSGAFKNLPSLESVDLSGSALEKVSSHTFEGSNNLKTVNLSGCTSLEIIGSEAFNNLLSLESVDLSGSAVDEVCSGVFQGSKNLKTVDLSGCMNLSKLGSEAFKDLSSLESVDLSGTEIHLLYSGTFEGCNNLKTVDLSNCTKLKDIRTEVFYNLPGLESVDLSNTAITEFVSDTFNGCSNLKYLNLTGITSLSIAENTFQGCDSLLEVKTDNEDVQEALIQRFQKYPYIARLDIGEKQYYDLEDVSYTCYPGSISITVHTTQIGDFTLFKDTEIILSENGTELASIEGPGTITLDALEVGVHTFSLTFDGKEISITITVQPNDAEFSSLNEVVSIYYQLKEAEVFLPEDIVYLEKLISLAPWDATEDQQAEVDAYAEMLLREIYDRVSVKDQEGYLPAEPINGWKHYASGSFYYRDGVRTKGFADIDGDRYYFNEQGIMQTGWVELDSGWYYFDQEGKMVTGWLQQGNVYYYLDLESGRMYDNGLAQIDKHTYYFYEWGGMACDWWYQAEDGWYFFGGNGAMKAAQWLEWKGEWYYLTETGKMAVDSYIGDYYVNKEGIYIA